MQAPQFPFRTRYWINQQYSENQVNYPSGRHGGLDIQCFNQNGSLFPAHVYPVLSGRTLSVDNTDRDRGKGIRVRTDMWAGLAEYLQEKGLQPGRYIEFLYWHLLEVTDLDNTISQDTPVGQAGNTGNVWSSQFPGANGLQPVPEKYKGVPPYYGLHLHLECRTVADNGSILNTNKDVYGRIDPLLILNYPAHMLMGYKVKDNPTVYVSVGTTLVPVADWNAFINLGGSEQSIVSLDATEFAKFNVGSSTLFKSA